MGRLARPMGDTHTKLGDVRGAAPANTFARAPWTKGLLTFTPSLRGPYASIRASPTGIRRSRAHRDRVCRPSQLWKHIPPSRLDGDHRRRHDAGPSNEPLGRRSPAAS